MDNIVRLELPDLLKVEGINCKGFGIIPKFVMFDTDLSIEAKAIYAYFCSFAGNGNTAFPGRDLIVADLGINKDTFYKHFDFLTEQGYVKAEQVSLGGYGKGFQKNIYTLISNPKKFSTLVLRSSKILLASS